MLTRPSRLSEARHLLRLDFATHNGGLSRLILLIFRLGQWSVNSRSPLARAARPVLRVLDLVFVRVLIGAELPFELACGGGLSLQHAGRGIVITPGATLGEGVVLFHGVTLARDFDTELPPTLGDRVVVGVGAVVLGNITIGDDSFIGANAVANRDVAPGTRVAGVPARRLTARRTAESGHSSKPVRD
jgi:serine O-acetyltransferase